MTSRKSSADLEGWKKGSRSASVSEANKFGESGKFKLNRAEDGNDPWRNPEVLSDGLSDGKGAYTDNKLVLNRKDAMTPENHTNEAAHDISDVVEENQMSGGGPLKPRGGQT